jgi:GH35 family endo-1,4-beta-xylanase
MKTHSCKGETLYKGDGSSATPGTINITSPAPITTAEVGDEFYHQVSAFSSTNQTLTFSLENEPVGMNINSKTGVITWTPISGQTSSGPVLITVTDQNGNRDEQVLHLTVNPPTDPIVVEPGDEITDPTLDCTPIVPQVWVPSPNKKKSISEIDAISLPNLVTVDPVEESANYISGGWGSISSITSDPPPGFGKYSSLVKEDIVFISFFVKAISNNHNYNGTHLIVRYKSSSGASDELDRMIVTIPQTGIWQRVYYPVRINSNTITDYAENIVIDSPQEFEQEFHIGGFSFQNFKQTIAFLDFPNFEEYYFGMEENAQWRKDALLRIQNIRMKDINISFKDPSNEVIKNICVSVKQIRHKFSFAGAVETYDPGNIWFEQHFTLFNETTMRNAQKWKASSKNETDDEKVKFAEVDQYLNPAIARGNVIRSHAVLWPKFDNTPSWVKDYLQVVANPSSDPDLCEFRCDSTCKTLVKNAFNNRIREVLTYYKGIIYEWDFINEPNDGSKNNTGYNGDCILGKSVFYEWIDYARSIDPALSIAINEYGLIDRAGLKTFNKKFPLIEEMVNTDKARNPPNGNIDAIGLQGHFNGASSILDMQNQVDILSTLGKKIKLTEADIFIYNEDTQGKFIKDIIILFFASSSFDGITFWNWNYDPTRYGEKQLEMFYRSDGSMKPMASQYMNTIYNQFWIMDSKGIDTTYTNKLYYGEYEVTATLDGVAYPPQIINVENGGPSDFSLTIPTN